MLQLNEDLRLQSVYLGLVAPHANGTIVFE